MKISPNHITVFEHEILKVGTKGFTENKFESLIKFYGVGVPYFTLVYKGVKFNEYVGVIQIDGLIIEVLPKADKAHGNEAIWRNLLIGMLRKAGIIHAHAPSSSNLSLKYNSILEFYFEMFIKEVEYLVHKGLVKKYRRKDGNKLALKGSIQFGKHIQKNLVHKERFFVRHTAYDKEHLLHQIINETLYVLRSINRDTNLKSRIENLILYFPEQKRFKATESVFPQISYNRKTESYKGAIDIAKLILLNYHPDLTRGHNNVLALMFDMNFIWEKFVYITLRGNIQNYIVKDQVKKLFWKCNKTKVNMVPDIVLYGESNLVLDTKWKNLYGCKPSPDDLRQLYAYSNYFSAHKVALIYPGEENDIIGKYVEPNSFDQHRYCGVIQISLKNENVLVDNIKLLQGNIINSVKKFINHN